MGWLVADARQWKICRGLRVSAFGLLSLMFRRMRIELNPQKLNHDGSILFQPLTDGIDISALSSARVAPRRMPLVRKRSGTRQIF